MSLAYRGFRDGAEDVFQRAGFRAGMGDLLAKEAQVAPALLAGLGGAGLGAAGTYALMKQRASEAPAPAPEMMTQEDLSMGYGEPQYLTEEELMALYAPEAQGQYESPGYAYYY